MFTVGLHCSFFPSFVLSQVFDHLVYEGHGEPVAEAITTVAPGCYAWSKLTYLPNRPVVLVAVEWVGEATIIVFAFFVKFLMFRYGLERGV